MSAFLFTLLLIPKVSTQRQSLSIFCSHFPFTILGIFYVILIGNSLKRSTHIGNENPRFVKDKVFRIDEKLQLFYSKGYSFSVKRHLVEIFQCFAGDFIENQRSLIYDKPGLLKNLLENSNCSFLM